MILNIQTWALKLCGNSYKVDSHLYAYISDYWNFSPKYTQGPPFEILYYIQYDCRGMIKDILYHITQYSFLRGKCLKP